MSVGQVIFAEQHFINPVFLSPAGPVAENEKLALLRINNNNNNVSTAVMELGDSKESPFYLSSFLQVFNIASSGTNLEIKKRIFEL